MESRDISLTIEKAKEWFNSGNEALKEAALQAYTKDELSAPEWASIKTYADARRALGIQKGDFTLNIDGTIELNTLRSFTSHVQAMLKLDTILTALNGKNWKPKLTKEGEVYYPYVRVCPVGSKMLTDLLNKGFKSGPSFVADDKVYVLVGAGFDSGCYPGLLDYSEEFGDVVTDIGILGCRNELIARHMATYFSKEIFEAIYAKYVGTYKWI